MVKKISFVVYRIVDGKPLFLVARRPVSKIWQYPTAKCEVDENYIDCAFREIEEELGEVKILNFTDLRHEFSFHANSQEYVENALAFEISEVVQLQQEEFDEYKFLEINEAKALVEYDNHRDILQKVYDLIETSKITKFFIIVAPTACGKSVIIKDLLEKFPDEFERVKTYMTREFKRAEDSLLRIHVSKAEFEDLDRKGLLIEKNFHDDNWYGSSYKLIESAYHSGKNLIAEIDINGAKHLKGIFSNIVTIFITAPIDEIEFRLRERGGHNEPEIARRLEIAKREILQKDFCDFIVENRQGEYETTFKQIVQIIEKNKGTKSLQ